MKIFLNPEDAYRKAVRRVEIAATETPKRLDLEGLGLTNFPPGIVDLEVAVSLTVDRFGRTYWMGGLEVGPGMGGIHIQIGRGIGLWTKFIMA